MTKRQTTLDRTPAILRAALALSRSVGYTHITRDAVGRHAACSPATVSLHFTTMSKLRRAVMGEALRTGDLRVIGQGLAARDPRALKAPESVRRAAVEALMG